MITVYFTNEKQELITYKSTEIEEIYSKIVRKSWIHLTNPTELEIQKITSITAIPEVLVRTTLDEEESAHIDVDDDVTLVVVDMPFLEKDEDYQEIHKYSTTPFGIMFNNDYYLTTCLKTNSIEQVVTSRLMKNFGTNKHIKLTIQILYRNASRFVNHLKQLDKDSESVQKRLQQSLKNKELFELMSLGKSLVYLSTGINADNLVLEKIKRHELFKQYEEDYDLIEDTIIESRQAMEMCSIHRDILNGAMDAFASVISNNVNTVMKTLTVVTIVLTIPTLVASFFGMNVRIPFEDKPAGFWIALVISTILSTIGAVILIKYTSKVKKRRSKK
jgi:magnesium transporter